MSARGARSRKAVAKDIEKQEKKAAQKGKAVDPTRRADWHSTITPTTSSSSSGIPSRQLTVSTSRSSSTNGSASRPPFVSVHSSDYHTGLRSRNSDGRPASVSDTSSVGKEKKRYQANGKDTKAPRGRRGGVPVKTAVSTTPLPPMFRAETSLQFPSATLSPSQRTWIDFRIWEGGDHSLRPYGGFDFDEDLQTGTVLIFFKDEQMSEDRPVPQLRAELDVLENCGSTWLSNALLYGRLDDNDEDWNLGSPESTMPMQSYSPNFSLPAGQRQMLAPVSPGGMSPPPFNIDQTYYGVPGHASALRQYYPESEYSRSQSQLSSTFRSPQQATHELWFAAPAHLKTPQAQRLHHVAVRNFIAMLHKKPIVGADLYEMLSTLQPEIQVMYDLDHDEHSRISSRERSVQLITEYLDQHKLDDVRNSIKTALNLLAWAESDNVKWREGYLESFVHLAGILNPQIEELKEFKRLSVATRRNLGIAAKTLQLRVIEAEEQLTAFDLSDLWTDLSKAAGTPVYQSYQAFRQFLINYYTAEKYGNWPPTQGSTWLNRKIVLNLQRDFGALYDYLVNRDVVWDAREERPGNKWQMVNQKTASQMPPLFELSLSDMLVNFDNKHSYTHIPHAYPLLPKDIAQTKAPQKKGLFGGLKKSKVDAAKENKARLQLSVVFSDASNIEKLDGSLSGNAFIDRFLKFELDLDLNNTTPRESRLGSWVLLYGILQVLSTLSVDVQLLKYTEGVRYFLCCDLKRCPEWVTGRQTEALEATQQRSWCWQRSWDPTPIKGQPVELEARNPPVSAEELDSNTLDGATMLANDIRRIGEKIDNMGFERQDARLAAQRELQMRRENEKVMQGEFITQRMDQTFRISESDYVSRPNIPLRNPMRSPGGTPLHSPGHQGREQLTIPSPGGYPHSPQDYPVSPQVYTMPQQPRPYRDEDRRGWL